MSVDEEWEAAIAAAAAAAEAMAAAAAAARQAALLQRRLEKRRMAVEVFVFVGLFGSRSSCTGCGVD